MVPVHFRCSHTNHTVVRHVVTVVIALRNVTVPKAVLSSTEVRVDYLSLRVWSGHFPMQFVIVTIYCA